MASAFQYPEPQAVFAQFAALAAIPHGSGNTATISRYCLQWAQQRGLAAMADAMGNVVIRKPATAGCETRPTVILQGHLDMVCAKDPDCPKHMETEGLTLRWTDDFLSAEGTTLGGDDGIAVAYALALLEAEDIPHPPLTVILTVDEEIGMLGASALSPDVFDAQDSQGKPASYLLNLDSEEEDIFTVGCAGGVRVNLAVPAARATERGTLLTFRLSGLQGGHSGTEIHRPLLNANVAMGRLLRAIPQPIRLCAWEGGTRDNVIPTEATVRLLCIPCAMESLLEAVAHERDTLRAEYPDETGLTLRIDPPVKSECAAVSAERTAEVLAFFGALPNGVQTVHPQLQSPQTSLNLGIVSLQRAHFCVSALVRSSVDAEKASLTAQLRNWARAAGGDATTTGDYPAWEYQPNTDLERIVRAAYQHCFGTAPNVQTIHAGLECGILTAKSPQLQCISFGPDILDIHTPRERLSIPSVARTWNLLLEILRRLGNPDS